jgi:hypothetical protein
MEKRAGCNNISGYVSELRQSEHTAPIHDRPGLGRDVHDMPVAMVLCVARAARHVLNTFPIPAPTVTIEFEHLIATKTIASISRKNDVFSFEDISACKQVLQDTASSNTVRCTPEPVVNVVQRYMPEY